MRGLRASGTHPTTSLPARHCCDCSLTNTAAPLQFAILSLITILPLLCLHAFPASILPPSCVKQSRSCTCDDFAPVDALPLPLPPMPPVLLLLSLFICLLPCATMALFLPAHCRPTHELSLYLFLALSHTTVQLWHLVKTKDCICRGFTSCGIQTAMMHPLCID